MARVRRASQRRIPAEATSAPPRRADYELEIHVSLKEVPPALSTPGAIITTSLSSLQATAVAVLELMPPVPVALDVTEILVNVTTPKSAREASEQLPEHTSGLSVITSALAAAGAASVITVENVQPAVLFTTFRVH
jgi:hypothetical protein